MIVFGVVKNCWIVGEAQLTAMPRVRLLQLIILSHGFLFREVLRLFASVEMFRVSKTVHQLDLAQVSALSPDQELSPSGALRGGRCVSVRVTSMLRDRVVSLDCRVNWTEFCF